MTENELLRIVDEEIAKSQNNLNTLNSSSSWIDKGKYAQKSIHSLHTAVAALATLIKGAVRAD